MNIKCIRLKFHYNLRNYLNFNRDHTPLKELDSILTYNQYKCLSNLHSFLFQDMKNKLHLMNSTNFNINHNIFYHFHMQYNMISKYRMYIFQQHLDKILINTKHKQMLFKNNPRNMKYYYKVNTLHY